ncbi:MAG TPA: efflux RND transporter periplasmic adaptor subunit [Aquabacterium sp.]|uniref:efflux RND transporter periplasmic adaptor subunit n=1 Tax=Aquabacterium sp. TaxID=1872578 RepID=UPI002E2F89CC|nr:efflux RND transporter periplasmic adaptor subunit [Aquabacterium sp.]HEX5372114.1 efflux RND transporter periplasmic adaptor subunit [Aquabacterium sp.]
MTLSSRPVWRRPAVWGGAVVIVALVLLGAWLRWQPVAVDAVVLRSQPLVRSLQFTARVETPARVEVGTTVTGRVAQVLVREGDEVKAGAPLLVLESDEWRAALAQAQASWQQAQAQVPAAERDLARVRDLVRAQFYSPARLDEAVRNVDVARAQRNAARAAVEAAQARLDQATVRAPGAGRVLTRQVEPGQIVQAGHGLLWLSVAGPLDIVAQVDERFLGQLQRGQGARVLADAYPDQPFEARLERLAPSVDAQRGAVEVTFAPVGRPPAFLREDMTLSVEVVTGERQTAMVLPLRALRAGLSAQGAERGTVLVVEEGVAREREVGLGLRTLDLVEVTGGLSAQQSVLLDPGVAPGTRVRTRTPGGAGASSSGTTKDNVGGAMTRGFGG